MNREQLSAVQHFIRTLVTAVSTATLYSLDHQQVTRLVSVAYNSLIQSLTGTTELKLMYIDEQLVVDDTPLQNSLYINRFIQLLKPRGIQYLKISKEVMELEILTLVKGLSRKGAQDAVNTENIRFGKVSVHYSSGDEETFADESSQENLTLDNMSTVELAKFMEIYEAVRKNKKLSIVGLNDIVGGFIKAFRQEADSLLAFAPLRAMDEYTFTHSTNVCVLNISQAMSLGIEGPLLHDIGIAAMLHDIGKLFIPEEILNKAGKLTDEEFQIIQQHPLRGAQHLLDTPGVPRLAVVSAYEHHMKYNFSGYPKVNSGWEQNLCSQMTTISDFFDALRTKRSYRGSIDWDTVAINMYELSGIDFHPALVKNFLLIMDRLRKKESPPNVSH